MRDNPLVGDTDKDQKLLEAGTVRRSRIQAAATSKKSLSGL